jgi:hypothetical protein
MAPLELDAPRLLSVAVVEAAKLNVEGLPVIVRPPLELPLAIGLVDAPPAPPAPLATVVSSPGE